MSESSPPHWPAGTTHLQIHDVVIELATGHVQRPDGDAELTQRVLDLLALLAAEPHRLHTRAELLERVWSGVIVEDANLSQSIWMLRKALGDERKVWIRTVSKRGYAFEPTGSVQAIAAQVESPAITFGNPPADGAPATPVSPVDPPPRTAWWKWAPIRVLANAVLMLGLVAAVIALPLRAPKVEHTARSVTLIRVEDAASKHPGHVQLDLLQAWLEWKLSSIPTLEVLTEAQLAADPDAQARNSVVLLFSGPSPDTPDQLLLRASVRGGASQAQFQQTTTPAKADAAIDALSRQIVATLAPEETKRTWPALKASVAATQVFSRMLQFAEAHDWMAALATGKELIGRSPDFALGQMRYAQIQATLGQLPVARTHLQRARALLHPMPAHAAELLDAQLLALSPDHAAAADAYLALSRRYPTQPHYSLQQARAVARTGRFEDALKIISGPVWQRPLTVKMQYLKQLNVARLQTSLGDHDAAASAANRALHLATSAGSGWEYERAHALLTIAQADDANPGTSSTSEKFESAARAFDQIGDTFAALNARFLGEIANPPTSQPRYYDTWIAKTREAGQRQLELSALRSVAFHYYRAGNIQRYRKHLTEAAAVAQAINDTWSSSAIEMDLINEDYLTGDFASVDQRLARFRANKQQGFHADWADLFDAIVSQFRGNNRHALASLQQGASAGRSSNPTNNRYRCFRGSIQLTMGRPDAARSDYRHCPAADPHLAQVAELGLGEAALASGDRDTALSHLGKVERALSSIPTAPGRWPVSLDLATALASAGEYERAVRLYKDVLPPLRAAGYQLLESYALIGLAEIATADGAFQRARELANDARKHVPRDAWLLTQRLSLVDAAVAKAHGDYARAEKILLALDREAHSRNDVLMQLRVHSVLLPQVELVESRTDRDALVADSGLRGVNASWLFAQTEAETQLATSLPASELH